MVDIDKLSSVLGIKCVRASAVVVDKNDNVSFAWGQTATLAYVQEVSDQQDISSCKTFVWSGAPETVDGYGVIVEPKYPLATKTTIVSSDWYWDVQVTAPRDALHLHQLLRPPRRTKSCPRSQAGTKNARRVPCRLSRCTHGGADQTIRSLLHRSTQESFMATALTTYKVITPVQRDKYYKRGASIEPLRRRRGSAPCSRRDRRWASSLRRLPVSPAHDPRRVHRRQDDGPGAPGLRQAARRRP